MPTLVHITSRMVFKASALGDDFSALGNAAEADFSPGFGAGLPGSVILLRLRTGASLIMAWPARAPNTSPSRRELLARRFAPWTPVAAVSPAEYKPGREVRPHRSVFTPPIM